MEWIEIVRDIVIGLVGLFLLFGAVEFFLEKKRLKIIVQVGKEINRFGEEIPDPDVFKQNIFEQIPSIPKELSVENQKKIFETSKSIRYLDYAWALIASLIFFLEIVLIICEGGFFHGALVVIWGFALIGIALLIKKEKELTENINDTCKSVILLKGVRGSRKRNFLEISEGLGSFFALTEKE